MIDTKELRRLAQAATPGPWINHGRQPNVAGLPHSAVAAKTLLARVYSEAYGDVEQETANASFIAAANPAAISELLDRLEAAEKERDWHAGRCEDAMNECAALRAKIEQMEKQEPVGVLHVGSYYGEELQDWEFEANQRACDKLNEEYVGSPTSLPLYALPGAQAQNVPKAVAYLDLGTGGYMDIGTDLTDEALAALPKGRHMLGIVGTYGVDGYVPAQNAPSVLEGYKLVPIEPTPTMITAALESSHAINAHRAEHCYRAMLAAAPEAKL